MAIRLYLALDTANPYDLLGGTGAATVSVATFAEDPPIPDETAVIVVGTLAPQSQVVQEWVEVVQSTADDSRVTQEYVEVVQSLDDHARHTQEYVEVVQSLDDQARTSQEYVELVLRTPFIPDDVASATAFVPPVAFMPSGPVGYVDEPCEGMILTISNEGGIAAARVRNIRQVAGGQYETDDPPVVVLSANNTYSFSPDGLFLAVVTPTVPYLFFYRTDTWTSFIGPTAFNPVVAGWFPDGTKFAVYDTVTGVTNIYSVPDWTLLDTVVLGGRIYGISYDGSLAAIPSGTNIFIRETTGWTLVQTLAVAGAVNGLSWHPEDTHLAATHGNTGDGWTIWETAGWTTLVVPDVKGSSGGGFQGASFPGIVMFAPTGDKIALGQFRGLFNSAFVAVYTFPGLVGIPPSHGLSEGDTFAPYMDWASDGDMLVHASGSLNFPAFATLIGTISGPLGGNRAGQVDLTTIFVCGEGWNIIFL